MFRRTLAALLTVPLLVVAAEEPKPKAKVADLAWMTGSWASAKGEILTEESWTTPRAGIMLGTNRASHDEKATFEFLRIADTDKGVVYFASPNGKPATEFPLVNLEKEKATFENPKHDFPQRVIYWKAGAKLHARIEGNVGGRERGIEWAWGKAEK